MSFLIDPPWLYANGRAYAALAPTPQGRTAAAAGRHDGGLLGREHPALPQPPLDPPDLARLPGEQRARLDAQLRRAAARRRAPPGRAATRSAPRSSPPTRCWLWLGLRDGRRDDRAALPARPARQGPLRVLLPARRRPGAPARRLDPPHGAPSAPAGRRPARSGARCSDAEAGPPRAVKQTLPGPRRPAGWIAIGDSAFGPAARAGGPRRGPLGRLGAGDARRRRAAAPPPPRVDVPRAAPAHQAREPAADATFDGRVEADVRPLEIAAGAAWPATTGAPSTPALDLAARRRVRGRAGRVAGRRARPRASARC